MSLLKIANHSLKKADIGFSDILPLLRASDASKKVPYYLRNPNGLTEALKGGFNPELTKDVGQLQKDLNDPFIQGPNWPLNEATWIGRNIPGVPKVEETLTKATNLGLGY